MDPNVENGTKPLRMQKTAFFSKDLNALLYGNRVELIDPILLIDEDYRVKLLDKNCNDKSLSLLVTCPHVGNWSARIRARYNQANKQWSARVVAGGIAD